MAGRDPRARWPARCQDGGGSHEAEALTSGVSRPLLPPLAEETVTALAQLKARLLEVDDLQHAADLLRWDQTTYMPPGGASARGRQLATLTRLAHERFTDAEIGRRLEAAERETAGLPPDSDEASLVRVTRRLWGSVGSYSHVARVGVPGAHRAHLSGLDGGAARQRPLRHPAGRCSSARPSSSRRMAECFPVTTTSPIL
jgi:carboxypeptidase Taq